MKLKHWDIVLAAALIGGGLGCPSESAGNAVCGNAVVEVGEACDDGNTTAGDGCDATCQWEPCTDADGDGHEDATCGGDDCDDGDPANFPGNPEVCDGLDNDCQGGADDGLTFLDYWPDLDQDDHGDASATPVSACAPIAGSVTNGDDCDDTQ
ncbi:MAG: MopE-related protein [Deltaproteobacteria bacterium]|nr:MopE-related protein [Deltaproteobacteria bacterium]